MKKVVHLGVLPPMKGLSYYCYSLIKPLSKLMKVNFLAFKELYPDFLYPESNVDNDFKMDLEGVSVRRDLTYYNPISWIDTGLVDAKLVHGQWWSPPTFPIFFIIFLMLKVRGVKLVLTVHNVKPHGKNFLLELLDRLIMKFPDRFIVHTEGNKDVMSEFFGIEKKRIKVIPHMLFDMYGLASKEESLKYYKFDKKKYVLFFGIIREYKGIDTLLEAMKIVQKKDKDIVLVVAGKPWEDWENYQKIIDDNKLNVKLFLKYIPKNEVKYLFGISDLVVLPYKKFDAQSGVGGTVMFYEKPMVVTDVGGLPEQVKNKEMVVPKEDPEKLAKAILRSFEIHDLLVKDAKEIKKEFTPESVAEKTFDYYRELLD